jgi:hypothetical protein
MEGDVPCHDVLRPVSISTPVGVELHVDTSPRRAFGHDQVSARIRSSGPWDDVLEDRRTW